MEVPAPRPRDSLSLLKHVGSRVRCQDIRSYRADVGVRMRYLPSKDRVAGFIHTARHPRLVRVLHVTKKLPPAVGGDATAVAALGRVQRRNDHRVHFLAYRANGVVEGDDTHLVGPTLSGEALDRIGFRRIVAMRAIRRWARTNLRALRPDLVHAHAVDVGASVVGVARDMGVPVVLTCHGVWFPHHSPWSPPARIERSLLGRGYDAITSVDRPSVQALRAAGFRDAIHVPNGVDVTEFEGPHPRDGTVRFLFVGRHVYQKGIDELLEAAARIRPRLGNRFVLELVGDGPERIRLERKARHLDLAGTARFHGSLPRPKLLEAYRRADALVLPSRYEGFPLVILEAWAAGLPVIATAVGGVPDLCDERNAILVPPNDPDALADALVSLASDPMGREALGMAGRSLVQARYTWDAIAKQYEKVYEDCLARMRRVGR